VAWGLQLEAQGTAAAAAVESLAAEEGQRLMGLLALQLLLVLPVRVHVLLLCQERHACMLLGGRCSSK
jgi:hypothetical protein